VILLCFSLPLLATTGLSSARELDHRKLATASQQSFGAIAAGQDLAILAFSPALFAGAIASEFERGSLVLLLASPLSSVAIILGKLGPRMAQFILIIAAAIPVLGLLSLNGGVDVALVVLADGVLLSSAFLIASMAILISIMSASVRQAVLWTYIIEGLWLAAPVLCDGVASYATPILSEWAGFFGDLFALTSPVLVLEEIWIVPPTIATDFLKTILVQLSLGALFIITAAALLRPVARGSGLFGWRPAPVSFLWSRRRLLPRPGCGERPVLWKEMHFARSRVWTRLVLAFVLLGALIPLGWTTWAMALPAFQEVATAGYGLTTPIGMRGEFNELLRIVLGSIYIILAIGLAVFSATSVTSEMEKDTWTSLIASPLSAPEIVSQKLIGAGWRLSWLGFLYIVFMALGLAAGAIHPLGGILGLVQVTVFLGFVAGLGMYFSLVCESSVHALGWTFFLLILVNGGYLLGCFLLDPNPIVFFLVTPWLNVMSLATYPEVDWLVRGGTDLVNASQVMWLIILNGIFYAVSAAVLCYSCVRALEKAAGRPRRGRAVH
jgi:ABC-type transport system involved in multi-copper enzyme maturation permease subunit